MSELHHSAREGFGAAAAAYQRGRPGFPGEAIAWLRERLELGPGSCIVDLGAGTGKLTEQLLEDGLRPIAVEPVDAMRETLAARLPVEVVDATAERMPFAGGSLDAVLAAQAFHWFRGREALAEIARVLRPGGGLGLVWNRRDEAVPWVARLSALIEPHRGDAPAFASGAWREAFAGAPGFTPLEEAQFPHAHDLTPDALLDRVRSISFVAALPQARRRRLLRDVASLVAGEPSLAGRRLLRLPYRTYVYTCRRADEHERSGRATMAT
jgi:SAM-dependent methyltransferase